MPAKQGMTFFSRCTFHHERLTKILLERRKLANQTDKNYKMKLNSIQESFDSPSFQKESLQVELFKAGVTPFARGSDGSMYDMHQLSQNEGIRSLIDDKNTEYVITDDLYFTFEQTDFDQSIEPFYHENGLCVDFLCDDTKVLGIGGEGFVLGKGEFAYKFVRLINSDTEVETIHQGFQASIKRTNEINQSKAFEKRTRYGKAVRSYCHYAQQLSKGNLEFLVRKLSNFEGGNKHIFYCKKCCHDVAKYRPKNDQDQCDDCRDFKLKPQKFDVFVTERCDGNVEQLMNKIRKLTKNKEDLPPDLEYLDDNSRRKLQLEKTWDVIIGILTCVQEITRSGESSHNDIKPKNFLYKGDIDNFEILIADFGMSGQRGGGTPGYSSPELHDPVPQASDYFSTAVTLLEVMCETKNLSDFLLYIPCFPPNFTNNTASQIFSLGNKNKKDIICRQLDLIKEILNLSVNGRLELSFDSYIDKWKALRVSYSELKKKKCM